MQETIRKELVQKIKEKKELAGIADIVVLKMLEAYIKKSNIKVARLKEKQSKIIIKEIRADLRKLVGQYHPSTKKAKTKNEILKAHASTAERITFYPKLKKIIQAQNPKSILDLGCGVNPIALATKKYIYHASDINEKDLLLVKAHLTKNKITGRVFIHDLTDHQTKLPKTDLCLIFKVLDIIGKKHTESILGNIAAKKLIISFATKKLSGKKMMHPRRIWFEKLLHRKNQSFTTIESANEIFYIIHR